MSRRGQKCLDFKYTNDEEMLFLIELLQPFVDCYKHKGTHVYVYMKSKDEVANSSEE